MRTLEQLISDLGNLGIKLRVEGDRLKVRAPKGALGEELGREISERKGEILAFLCKTRAPSAAPTITRVRPPRDGVWEPSYAQKRMWFIAQREDHAKAYNIPSAVRLHGRLCIGSLRQSLSKIAERHGTLRSSFFSEEGKAYCRIENPREAPLPIADVGTAVWAEPTIQRLANQESQRPFDLTNGPVWRAVLLRKTCDDHVLLITMHHIVSDGWSIGVFVNELRMIYDALVKGLVPELAQLPIQYWDYAEWQRNWLTGEVIEAQLNYWRRRLEGLPVLSLNTDYPRPRTRTFTGKRVHFQWDAELTRRIRERAREYDVSSFILLHAVLSALLTRYSGQTDIAVGTPVANRRIKEMETLIGFFVNTLVLRTEIADETRFDALLGQTRQVDLEAYQNQDCPFEQVVAAVKPERELSLSPLFQIIFALENTPLGEVKLAGLSLSPLTYDQSAAKFDVSLWMTESNDGLNGAWEYNVDLFEHDTMERFSSHFRNLAEAFCRDPGLNVLRAPIMTERERALILRDLNETKENPAESRCCHHSIESIRAANPDAVAVELSGPGNRPLVLTYEALNARANKLSRFLVETGIAADSLVGICLNRSPETAVAMLAVLKAGGAYLPIDASYPSDRLSFMLQDSGVGVLIAQVATMESLPFYDLNFIYQFLIDEDWENLDDEPDTNPGQPVDPANLAYVIYTSGSTGKPKGTGLTHSGLTNLVSWHNRRFQVAASDRASQLAGFAFDAAVWETWPYLVAGARLCQVPPSTVSDPAALTHWWAALRISIAFLPTPLLERVLDQPVLDRLDLRYLLVGGDRLQRVPPANLPFQLVNNYGPTEATVVTTSGTVTPDDRGRPPAIGFAIDNTRALVLDPLMQIVPRGVPGELYIESAGLARAYLERPALTAEKFVPNPFAFDGRGGERLYRSGDITCLLADGSLAFLGRVDHQIKLRGFRIELGEIESVLKAIAGVSEALVLCKSFGRDDLSLRAYVVPKAGFALDPNLLREDAAKSLPDYMLPSSIICLDAFPLTANGKIDRAALPETAILSEEEKKATTRPSNPWEETLLLILTDLLHDQNIGMDDNFFDIGGHSLLATQVTARAREAFNMNLPNEFVFVNPTISEMAVWIEKARNEKSHVNLPPIQPVARDADLPLSFEQQRLWFLSQLDEDNARYNIHSSMAFDGDLSLPIMEHCLTTTVARHLILRTGYAAKDGKPHQIFHDSAAVSLPLVDLQGLDRDRANALVERLIRKEAGISFDLAESSLFRVIVLKLEPRAHIVLLTMHHIVADGLSVFNLVRELGELYEAVIHNRAPRLPDLPIQYVDFAYWQRRVLTGELLDGQITYWQNQLADLPPIHQIPTDRPRPSVQGFNGASVTFKVNEDVMIRHKSLGLETGTTLFMTLQASFALLLARYSFHPEIVIGTPVANRRHRDLEPLIGFFVNTLVLRNDVGGNPTFRELLARVRKTVLDAFTHQDVPFEQVVEIIQPKRGLSYNPLFQIMFTLNTRQMDEIVLTDLRISSLNIDQVALKFDLSLSMVETAQGLLASLEYNTELFNRETIVLMADHFCTLLAEVGRYPWKPIHEHSLMREEEYVRLLTAWNKPTPLGQPGGDLIAWLRTSLSQHAEREAILFELEPGGPVSRLTYRELWQRATNLAGQLKSLGLTHDRPVALCMERSLEMVVSVLAALLAGGAYLPLDPSLPARRLAFMLEETGADLLLAQTALVSHIDTDRASVLAVDERGCLVNAPSGEAFVEDRTNPDHLAFCIYTSGSTGKPKAVAVTRGGVQNHLHWSRQAYSLGPGDCFLQSASFAFDISFWEVFTPLLAGAKLCITSPIHGGDPAYLLDFIARYQINAMHFVPSLLYRLLQEGDWSRFTHLRQVFCGGELLPDSTRRLFFEKTKNVALDHFYGPSETVVNVTSWPCSAERKAGPVPLGKPIANHSLLVLSDHFQPQPPWVYGEICIAGAGLARGYLANAGLTAERFVPNPFSKAPGSRLYKTGDLGRYTGDGLYHFLGRIDQQVKLRGFRIEPGEITETLLRHERVSEAVVVVRGELAEQYLAAYLVLSSDGNGSGDIGDQGAGPELVAAMRAFLGQYLPTYMIPSRFQVLDALPKTVTGKINRWALPESVRAYDERSHVPPSGETEQTLADIWAAVLNLKKVGVHDDFFVLGGHSLLATQVVSRIRKDFNIVLPLVKLFQMPTISMLAKHIDNIRWVAVSPASTRDHGVQDSVEIQL